MLVGSEMATCLQQASGRWWVHTMFAQELALGQRRTNVSFEGMTLKEHLYLSINLLQNCHILLCVLLIFGTQYRAFTDNDILHCQPSWTWHHTLLIIIYRLQEHNVSNKVFTNVRHSRNTYVNIHWSFMYCIIHVCMYVLCSTVHQIIWMSGCWMTTSWCYVCIRCFPYCSPCGIPWWTSAGAGRRGRWSLSLQSRQPSTASSTRQHWPLLQNWR